MVFPGTHKWDGQVETSQTHTVVLKGVGKEKKKKKARKRGDENLDDAQREGEMSAVMPRGSCMFYRGSVLHGGGANQSGAARLGVILEYVQGWLRPQENHVLAVPQAIMRTLPERLQELLGYNVSVAVVSQCVSGTQCTPPYCTCTFLTL